MGKSTVFKKEMEQIYLFKKCYNVYFEIGLVNSLRKVFKNIKRVGCYYHYTRALKETARDMKLLTKDKK